MAQCTFCYEQSGSKDYTTGLTVRKYEVWNPGPASFENIALEFNMPDECNLETRHFITDLVVRNSPGVEVKYGRNGKETNLTCTPKVGGVRGRLHKDQRFSVEFVAQRAGWKPTRATVQIAGNDAIEIPTSVPRRSNASGLAAALLKVAPWMLLFFSGVFIWIIYRQKHWITQGIELQTPEIETKAMMHAMRTLADAKLNTEALNNLQYVNHAEHDSATDNQSEPPPCQEGVERLQKPSIFDDG